MNTEFPTNGPLTPPDPVKHIDSGEAADMVKLDPDALERLDTRIGEYVSSVLESDVQSDAFKRSITDLHSMGNDDIRAAAGISNRMLDRSLRTMKSGVMDDGSVVSKALLNLRQQVEDLDPSSRHDLLSPRKLLGLIPLGNGLKRYFRQYQSAQTQINAVIDQLYRSQDELNQDNAAIEEEKAHAWEVMRKLEEFVYVAKGLDATLSARAAELESTDGEKARIVKEELVFYARQKVEDFLTQLAVTIQGYLTMDLVRKNNLELIKGIDRATTTTVSALRTAVTAAQALTNQKLVLDQVSALNATTGNLVEATSVMLKQNAADIHQQASGTTIELAQLQRSFENVYAAMDMIGNYKVQALDSMQRTVDLLSNEVGKAKQKLVEAKANDGLRDPQAETAAVES